MINDNSDPKRAKLAKWLKIGIAVAFCVAISPIMVLAIQGLVGLIVALGIGLAAINLAPWFSIKMATWTLKLIKKDAAENPVETRQQIEQEAKVNLSKFLDEIQVFEANLSSFRKQVKDIVTKYPEKTETYKTQLAQLEQLLKTRKAMWQNARDNLKAYEEETVEISDLWDMANSAVTMNKMAGKLGEDPMRELRTRVANNAVHNKMNLAMAQLSTSLMEETPTPMISMESANIISIKLKEPEYALPNSR